MGGGLLPGASRAIQVVDRVPADDISVRGAKARSFHLEAALETGGPGTGLGDCEAVP